MKTKQYIYAKKLATFYQCNTNVEEIVTIDLAQVDQKIILYFY